MADNKNKLKIPPQHLEAEMALLGSIMIRPETMYDIMDVITKDSFYSERNKAVFENMIALFTTGKPIDMLSLSSRLSDLNRLDYVGGASYLTELVNSVPSSSNAKNYADMVQKKYVMRRLVEASEHISGLAYDDGHELIELIDKAEKKIFEITNFSSTHRFVELKDTLAEAWDRIDKLHNSSNDLRGVSTGFIELDNLLSGFQKSDLIILAARPSMGKTSLALDMARHAAIRNNIPVGIFSLEMSSQQLVDRMLASESNVDAWKLRTGKLNRDEEFGALRASLDKLAKAPIFIDDQPGNNIMKMRSVARRLKSEKGLGLIIVDYLQLMMPSSSKNNDNVVQQVTEISRSLKQMARELDVPVLALSQLSRAVESRGGKPRLSDLRDSGSIEQDADVVMFIHRDDKQNENSDKPNIAEILIQKHRNGPTGEVQLFFNDKKSTFQSISKANFGGADKEFNSF